MKRVYFFFLFLGCITSFAQNNLAFFREKFHDVKTESDLKFIIDAKVMTDISKHKNIISAYKGVCTSMMAEHAFLPTSKLSYFLEGTKLIDKAIVTKKSVEVIYLRLLVELNVPRFLNYYKNIDSDLAYFKANIKKDFIPLHYKKLFVKTISEIDNDKYDLASLKNIKLD